MNQPTEASPRRRTRKGWRSDAGTAGESIPRRVVRAISTAGVLAVVVLAQVGLVLAPSQLGRNPLLVLALRPTPAFLVLVAELITPATAVLVASAGRTLVDVAYFAVARHGALPIAQRLGIGRDLTRGVSRRTASRGLLAVSFFWSSSPVIAALGLGRTPPLTFLAVTGAGNVATSCGYVLFGRRFSEYLAPVLTWVSAQGTALTIGLAVAVALGGVVALRRTRSEEAVAAGS